MRHANGAAQASEAALVSSQTGMRPGGASDPTCSRPQHPALHSAVTRKTSVWRSFTAQYCNAAAPSRSKNQPNQAVRTSNARWGQKMRHPGETKPERIA
jgi:hypothetical protein